MIVHVKEEVTLSQVLALREDRVRWQGEMLACGLPVISFSMNIAGPVKTSPLIRRAMADGVFLLRARLGETLRREERHPSPAGDTVLFSVDREPAALKEICLALEEEHPCGRLFDLDVIAPTGEKLARPRQRGCFVCGKEGSGCAARRLHSVEELQKRTHEILTEGLLKRDAERLADLAVRALLTEARTTPKPGLVDGRNSGSHRDMDLALFEKSARSLRAHFAAFYRLARENARRPHDGLYLLLQKEGVLAERSMLAATGGVNTHKGAVFSMGLILGALGLFSEEEPFSVSLLSDFARHLAAMAPLAQLRTPIAQTAGASLYRCGIGGVRGEALEGFPTVAEHALPFYRALLSRGLEGEYARCLTLLRILTLTEDSNLHRRGGAAGAAFARGEAERLLSAPQLPTKEALCALDDAFIARNLSPGGAADLLALTELIYLLEEGALRERELFE